MKITDDREWNSEKCLNRFNTMDRLYEISNFVNFGYFPFYKILVTNIVPEKQSHVGSAAKSK